MDEAFKALADANRRQLLDRLNARNGQSLRELSAGLGMARQSVSKHLAILEAANLVTTRWQGREKLHFLNAEPINAIADRWIGQYHRGRARALADLKAALEHAPMAESRFVYRTVIKTTPEQLWQAITDPAFTSRYWGVTFETDWRAGSPVVWNIGTVRVADPEQVVLESDPPRRLVFSFHAFTPEVAPAVGLDDMDLLAKLAAEPRSKVTFEIEPAGETVKLTVLHDGFGPESALLGMVSDGWIVLISSLKTLLETGAPLPE